MTTHRIKGEIAFSCDHCTETVTPTHQENFTTAWAEAHAAGWRAVKKRWGVFEHHCPDCAETEQLRMGASE
jgi:hypothetical protein